MQNSMNMSHIHEIQTVDKELQFNLMNVDVSVVNSLRRVCLSNIRTLVFRGFPHEESNIDIHKNTTRFNNEFLKHRIQCIPIHAKYEVMENYMKKYALRLSAKNTSMTKRYITTQDFKIIDKNTGELLKDSDKIVSELFPVDEVSQEGILILVLLPHYKKNERADEIDRTLEFDSGYAKQRSWWNVVNKAAYENIQDHEKVNEKIAEMEMSGKHTAMEIKDYQLLDAQRIYVPNQFKFTLESNGIYQNEEIVKMACQYIINRMNQLENDLDALNTITQQSKIEQDFNDAFYSLYVHGEMNEFLVLKLKDDDYTIGKLIEKYLYSMFNAELEFVGFEKHHATEKEAYIYIKHLNVSEKESRIKVQLKEVCEKVKSIYTNIMGSV